MLLQNQFIPPEVAPFDKKKKKKKNSKVATDMNTGFLQEKWKMTKSTQQTPRRLLTWTAAKKLDTLDQLITNPSQNYPNLSLHGVLPMPGRHNPTTTLFSPSCELSSNQELANFNSGQPTFSQIDLSSSYSGRFLLSEITFCLSKLTVKRNITIAVSDSEPRTQSRSF